MTLPGTSNRIVYTGSGTGPYTVPFYFLEDADLVVKKRETATKTETALVITTDYSVSGAGNEAGGSITLVASLSSGFKLVIKRAPAKTQELDLKNNAGINTEALEEELDRLAMAHIEDAEEITRAVRLSAAQTDTFDPTLPTGIAAADRFLTTNASGTGWSVSISTTELSAVAASAAAAAASASAAATSASGAATSASAASSSASDAAAAAAGVAAAIYTGGVVNKTSTYTVVQGDNGKIITVDTSGGSVAINFSAVAGYTRPFTVGFLKTSASNTLTLDPNGAETINGSATLAISTNGAGAIVVCEGTKWVAQPFGDVADASITLAKMANLAQDQFIVRTTASTGVPETATCTEAARTVLGGASVAAMRTTMSAYGRVVKQTFTANGTYTPTSGMLHCIIEAVGGGGGGGAADGAASLTVGGGGGGAGQYSRVVATAATIGASQSVTIGAAGTAGATASGNGGNGGTTSVGAVCTAAGGTGGGGQANNAVAASGGAGGTGGTSDLATTGARGGSGFNIAGTNISVPGGYGGSSPWGTGGGGGGSLFNNVQAGAAGTGFGAGGSGGCAANTTSDAAGGAGSAGAVIITEFLPQ